MGELRGGSGGAIGAPVIGPATTLIERPPPGPARGPVPAPASAVVLLSACVAVLSVYALLRARKRTPT